jgi:hypothetical protein
MVKIKKNFEITYPIKTKVVRDLKIVTEHVGDLMVSGTAYCDPATFQCDSCEKISVDIDFIKWNGTDIKAVLHGFDTLEEIQSYCEREASKLFTNHETEGALMKQQLTDTITLVNDMVGQGHLYLDQAVSIRPTKISYPFNVWALCAGPDHKLYVMDADQQWHPLENNLLGRQLIGLLHQRVQSIHQKIKKGEVAA